ncbi:MAG: hypothetical protein HY054_07030 [Proteobacteria bacterium]|nr:hypothetical protein [Pseudomonadota bacterium]
MLLLASHGAVGGERGEFVKFKFVTLAGCSVAALFASVPAVAQEAAVASAQAQGILPTGLEVLYLDTEASTDDRMLSTSDEIVGWAGRLVS